MSELHEIRRVRHELVMREPTVVRTQHLSAHFLRVTFGGPELTGFTSLGFDDHVKLFFRDPADPGAEPAMRDYTPRRFDAARQELDIEFVLHGHGPAATWAAQATAGQTLPLGGPRGSIVIPPDFAVNVLVGDTCAWPAISRRLEELPAGASAFVIVDTAELAETLPFTSQADVQIQWLHGGCGNVGRPACRRRRGAGAAAGRHPFLGCGRNPGHTPGAAGLRRARRTEGLDQGRRLLAPGRGRRARADRGVKGRSECFRARADPDNGCSAGKPGSTPIRRHCLQPMRLGNEMMKAICRCLPPGVLAIGLALAGCSFAPAYERPAAPISARWGHGDDASSPGPSSAAHLDWQAFVTDERLRNLVDVALANNRDLRQTLLNVEAARAQYHVQRADRLPGLEAQGSGTRQRVPGDLSSTGQAQIQGSYQAGVGLAAFELDLFGRVRSLSQAALQEYLANEEAARSAQISLVAEVVQAYLTRDSAQHRHRLTEQTLQSREASLELIALRRQAGAATALDYQEALGLTEQARADLERIAREYRQASNALGLLVGVGDVRLPESPSTGTLLVQNIAAGTPSELLVRRPDVQAAEHRLQSRNASIGAARAAFFPRISLTGLFGSASAELSDLFGSGQRAWSFTPQITLPIFDGGRNRANLDLATVRKDIAVAAYEQVVQTAFREVSDALAATDTLRREEDARRALAQSSRDALRLSEARYRAGVDDHLRYLDAQRSAFANQTALIETSTQRQIALATLFRTLGGGWSTSQAAHLGQDQARAGQP